MGLFAGHLGTIPRVVPKTGDPPAIRVLVAGDGLSRRPVLDGKAIPSLDSSEYAHVPESWLENRHRAGL